MSDLHVEQCGMQATNPVLQLIQKLQCSPGTNVDRGELSPIRNVNEPAAKDDLIVAEEPPPKVREVRGVAGFAVGQSEIGKLFVREWARSKRHGQLRLRPAGELCEFERFGIRGEQHSVSTNDTSTDVKIQGRGEIKALDRAVLEHKGAEPSSSPRQPAHQFAGIQRSAGNFLAYSQLAGVGPANWRVGILARTIEFMNARKVQVARDIQIAKDRRDSRQDVAETRQISCGGLREGESAGVTAGAGADRLGLEHGYTFRWIKTLQICGGRKAAEAAADHRDIDLNRQRCFLGLEVDRPRRFPPTYWVRILSQRWALSLGSFPRDADSRSAGTAKYSLLPESVRSSKSAPCSRYEARLETLGPLYRDFSLYLVGPSREVIRPLLGSLPDLFTSRTRRLEWINDTCVFT
jgi:hypothetical protein